MAKIKYTTKENTRVGTHSFYAIPVPNGVLSFDELMEEACENNTYSIEEMRGCVGRFMKTIQREVLRGWRCNLGENFLTIYPNIELSVKDHKDKNGNLVVATPQMVNAANAKSKLGCTIHKKFSQQFASEVQWLKVDAKGNIVEDEEDITDSEESAEKVNIILTAGSGIREIQGSGEYNIGDSVTLRATEDSMEEGMVVAFYNGNTKVHEGSPWTFTASQNLTLEARYILQTPPDNG